MGSRAKEEKTRARSLGEPCLQLFFGYARSTQLKAASSFFFVAGTTSVVGRCGLRASAAYAPCARDDMKPAARCNKVLTAT